MKIILHKTQKDFTIFLSLENDKWTNIPSPSIYTDI